MQVICEASPWLPAHGPKAEHLLQRSFPARSGSVPLRMVVTLVANLGGGCPNLLADSRCGIYERRPLVCRIYPAETNPFVQLDPDEKVCPPEAWLPQHALLQGVDGITSDAVRHDIQRWRELNVSDVEAKRKVCAALNLIGAAVTQEGFFIHSPQSSDLLEALSSLAQDGAAASHDSQWALVTDRNETLERLAREGAVAFHPGGLTPGPFEYIGLKR